MNVYLVALALGRYISVARVVRTSAEENVWYHSLHAGPNETTIPVDVVECKIVTDYNVYVCLTLSNQPNIFNAVGNSN
jgi:hypothetical protein